MTLESSLLAVHQLNPGEAVGYGARWRAERTTRIGVAAVGYGDGYPRHVRSGAPVSVTDQECMLAGRVSMDMINVDLSGAPQAQAGDPVLLWGRGLPVERIAEYADTIPYELVCGISQRVRVEYR
jgi:alanine racemase